MFSFLKKVLSVVGVILVVALVLNLNIGGRPARERALEVWQSEAVQKVYRVVHDRVMAVIRKDISVEDAFKPGLDLKTSSPTPPNTKPEANSNTSKASVSGKASDTKDTHFIQMEKLNDEDRKALEKILEKSSK